MVQETILSIEQMSLPPVKGVLQSATVLQVSSNNLIHIGIDSDNWKTGFCA